MCLRTLKNTSVRKQDDVQSSAVPPHARDIMLVQQRERESQKTGTAQLQYHVSFSNYFLYDAPSIYDTLSHSFMAHCKQNAGRLPF